MCCASCLVPSVVVTSAWVSPRVNSAEPWVRGSRLDLAGDGADLVGGAAVDAAAGVEHQLAQVLLLGLAEDLLDLGLALGELGLERLDGLGLGLVERRVALELLADGHGRLDLALARAPTRALRAPDRRPAAMNSRFGLPTAARSFSCRSMSGCAALCANISASTMTSSATCCAPPSTITMASRLAATIRSSSEVSRWATVGLTTNSPSMRPTRTPANGPAQGMSDRCSAAEAPVMASTSVRFSRSVESTVAMTCVSKRHPFGKSGRHGRSMRREVSTSVSVRRPSRLK